MKIAELKTFVVGNPPPHFGGRYFIFLKLVTDDGIEGIGEVYGATFGPHIVARMIEDVFDAPRGRRRPVPHRGALARRLRPRLLGPARHLAARRAQRDRDGLLGHRRQGGRQARLRAARRAGARAPAQLHVPLPRADGDATDVYTDPDLAAERAAEYAGARLHRGEVRPGRPVHDARPAAAEPRGARPLGALRRARCARRSATRCDLLFGTHGQFTPSGAIRLARRLEPYDPLWFEEPTPPELPEEMARVARATSIPIATGERLTTKYEFARVLETGAASILQLNLGRVGGLLEAKKIAGMAEAHYAQIAPHLYCGPGRRRRQHPARDLQPELPDPRGHPATGAASTPRS